MSNSNALPVGRLASVLRRPLPALALVAALVAGGTPLAAETYRLAPGDRVLVRIIQLENGSYVGTVDTAGAIRLPYIGTHAAAGKTLDELAQDIALSVAGRQIQTVRDGVASVIVLDEQDIFLDMDTYRPITVIGAVGAPGRVPFEPGMNVRAAIGSVGGAALVGTTERADQLANFRTRQAELRESEAWIAAELWRIRVLLADLPSDAPFEDEFQVVTDRLSESDIVNIRRLVDGARASLTRGLEDKSARIALTEKRIEFLETALSQYVTASQIEEERLQDVLSLSDRGLATVNALDNAREGALNASSRLLTTQAELAAAERDRQTLLIERQGLEEDYVQTLLDEEARVQRNLDETRARLESVNRELALSTTITDDESAADVRFILHRQTVSGEEVSTEVAPGTLLRPGDVLEVTLTFD